MDHSEEVRLRALRDSMPGRTLLGSTGNRYPIGERLGEGAQGWVFRANWNEPGGHPVVVKILRPDAASKDSLDRFRREATVLQLLSQTPNPNPHIVRFFDHAYVRLSLTLSGDMSTGGTWILPFTVMEHISGPTLEDVLLRAGGAGLPVERAMRLIRHIVLALQQVHANNLVHRDLKPSNILIETSTGHELAKVTDFGLVKLFDPRFAATTRLAGATMGYAPPEQFENRNERVGAHTDVFALAAISYELLSGQPAFPIRPGEHPMLVVARILSEARPALHRVPSALALELRALPNALSGIDSVLARALSPVPEERHRSVSEFWDALLGAFGPGGIPPRASKSVVASVTLREQGDVAQATLPLGSSVGMADGGVWRWRILGRPHGGERFRAVALSRGGATAFGVGIGGLARWNGATWTSLPVPSSVNLRVVQAIAPASGDEVLLSGEDALAVHVSPSGAVRKWRFDDPSLSFAAAFIDGRGALVAGSRGGVHPGGVVAELSDPIAVHDSPGVPRLRAVTRMASGALMACGDAGVVATFALGASAQCRSVCTAPLNAIAPLSDGSAVVAGGAGFVFQVWPDGRHKLEAIQTTRDMLALAVDERGTAWTGGVATRLLRRTSAGWTREGADIAHSGTILALAASSGRLVFACDDGLVVEGSRV
jgi:serine/threonine-protein kinase